MLIKLDVKYAILNKEYQIDVLMLNVILSLVNIIVRFVDYGRIERKYIKTSIIVKNVIYVERDQKKITITVIIVMRALINRLKILINV